MKILPTILIAACSLLSTAAAYADDAKAVIAQLDERLAKIGPAKIEGTEKAGADKTAPALYFGTRKINNNYDAVDDIKKSSGATATVSFTIHLTGKVWTPPLPRSIHAENYANFHWTARRSEKTGKIAIMDYFLTGVRFPEGSIIVDADKVFKYPTWMHGPWGFP